MHRGNSANIGAAPPDRRNIFYKQRARIARQRSVSAWTAYVAVAHALLSGNFMNMLANGPLKPRYYNEMYDGDGAPHTHYADYAAWLSAKPVEFMLQKQKEADTLYARHGITFAVYGDETGVERSIPF